MKHLKIIESRTAAALDQFPEWPEPQIALAGRSNVGKSSFLNAVTGEKGNQGTGKRGARVSNTPGRTRQIHFYRCDAGNHTGLVLVDLPGYGFAKASKKEIERWQGLIDSYLSSDPGPALLVSLVDSRHEAKGADLNLIAFGAELDKDLLVVATKADKLSNNEIRRNLLALRKGLNLSADPVAFSAKDGTGLERVLQILRGLSLPAKF
jgi:GTP-binding protein